MFRASTDDGGGQTFGDKINLSNSSDTESQNAEMVAAGDSVCLFHGGKPVQKLGQMNPYLEYQTMQDRPWSCTDARH
jgi:hypothetical protein